MENKVFYQLKPGENTQRQLICFPYLGGYANSFFRLANCIDENIEILALTLPGHGDSHLPPLQEMKSVLDLCYEELQAIIKPNCVFFGHSMGGVIAYFLTQRILSSGKGSMQKPIGLILSACSPPSYFKTNYSRLPHDDLMEHLISCGGIPQEIINEKKFLKIYAPVFRADFKILEDSIDHDYTPLDTPVYFLYGENDKIVTIDSVIAWSSYFKNQIHILPIKNGTHMFIHDEVTAVAKSLEKIVGHLQV